MYKNRISKFAKMNFCPNTTINRISYNMPVYILIYYFLVLYIDLVVSEL